jgi:type VI secretion system secreted protein VgrG
MRSISTETYVLWITLLLLAGFALAMLSGTLALSRARRMRYFQVRRDAVLRGWQLVFAGFGLLLAAGLAFTMGVPLMSLAIPPTPTVPPTFTASPTDIPPTFTATIQPSATRTGTATEGPSPTPTASDTPTVSPTPVLPEAFITPVLTATVTPPALAVAGDVRISLRDNCATTTSETFLDQLPKTIFAHFYYDSWLPGVQWSGVWLRDGEVVHVETALWDGSTGGCGFSDWDNDKNWWPPGAYEVQIFVGSRWLASGLFQIGGASPSATLEATTAATTAANTPAVSATASPTAAPTLTASATPSRTLPAPTGTATPRPTRTATATPSRTPTRTQTIYPAGIYGYAVIVLEGAATNARVRDAAPDGNVIWLVDEGEQVTVFVQAEIIEGVLWRRIGLANGLEGWIGDHLLEHLEPTP